MPAVPVTVKLPIRGPHLDVYFERQQQLLQPHWEDLPSVLGMILGSTDVTMYRFESRQPHIPRINRNRFLLDHT
jgi:hypothetical protein